jgi:hypothetical protein
MEFSKKSIVDFPYYYRKDGKPFFIIYIYSNITDIIEKAQKKYSSFDLKIVVPDEFKGPNYAKYISKYPQELREDWIPVSPGFDSSLEQMYLRDIYKISKNENLRQYFTDINTNINEVRKNPKFFMNRKDSETYKKQLIRALEHNPEIIFISSWNDWQFGNQIEPADEYGDKYISITAEILDRSLK